MIGLKGTLRKVIAKEIRAASGRRIPFSRFMELALYHPTEGYYMKECLKLGQQGDFFTNAHVGSVFGQVLGRFFLSRVPDRNIPWVLIEMGAGDGRITEQVCEGLMTAGVNPLEVHLYLIEISPYHRKLQQSRLSSMPFNIKWVSHLTDIPSASFSIVYSNELVDAFPVHRIRHVSEGNMCEVYVTMDPDTFEMTEEYGPISESGIQAFLTRFRVQLEVGQATEVNLQARQWLEEVADWMNEGYVLTIDYGGRTRELLSRHEGTLRFFHQHDMPQTPYIHLGDIDMTSHVNFESLQEWGKDVGLDPVFLSTQGHFLLQSGILDMLPDDVETDPFSVEAKMKRAIQQLVHPDGMGEVFQVLLQRKRG